MQKLLHALKYRGRQEVGITLGLMFGQEMKAAGLLLDAGMIIPVPLFVKKKKIRGYNQSDLLAEGFSEATGVPWSADILEKVKATETQTGKTKSERRDNVRDVFRIKNALPCQTVILIDDVLTTGATLEECIETLKQPAATSFIFLPSPWRSIKAQKKPLCF